MSIAADCPSCFHGDHSGHDAKWNVRPGLIGGSHCACSGDCRERAREAAVLLGELLSRSWDEVQP